jgi:hypothetical protein
LITSMDCITLYVQRQTVKWRPVQNRYVGDIGDYVKLAVLRKLAPGRRLGVAWWLLPDESHNNDGGHMEYLTRPNEWRHFDPDLFDSLLAIDKKRRDVTALEGSYLLPHAVFARDVVPCDVRPISMRVEARKRWLLDIRTRFKDCSLIFLDPDNGIAPERLRPTQRRAGKSAFISDMTELKRHHQAMVVYHHHSMRKGGHEAELRYLAGRLRESGFGVCGALRAKPWSPRAFFIVDGDEELRDRAREIARTWAEKIYWYSDTDLLEKPNSASAAP